MIEDRQAEKAAFASEHRTFAEREGYDVLWHPYVKAWFVFTPRKLRPGEKDQYFQDIAVAWEVAAIRAGRKITAANGPYQTVLTRPHVDTGLKRPGRGLPRNESK